MTRIALLICLVACGCNVKFFPDSDYKDKPSSGSAVSDGAYNSSVKTAQLKAAVAREVAKKIRNKEFADYAALADWMKPKNEAAKDYSELLDAINDRLKKDADGFVVLGEPEDDAKVWDEAAEGFERVK